MYEMIEVVIVILFEDKFCYLMGVGIFINIFENIVLGIDMFDCVMLICNGRNGMFFIVNGIINIKNKKWEDDFLEIDEMGIMWVDIVYSKVYLKYLFLVNEMLGR